MARDLLKPQGRNLLARQPKNLLANANQAPVQEKRGLIETAMGNLSNPKTKPLSPIGLPELVMNPLQNAPRAALSAAGIPEEDAYPMLGQAIGGRAGFAGAVAGASTGQGLRQIAKSKIRGEDISLGQGAKAVGKEAVLTGTIEGLTRGAGKVFFRKQIANKAMQGLSKKLGEMKKVFGADTSVSIPSEEIYLPMKQAMEEVAVPHGKQASILNRWLKFMDKNPKLNSKQLMEMESDLGQVADYGQYKRGAIVQPDINKPELNKIAKGSRKQVSDLIDELTGNTGMKFKETSRKLSKMLQKFPDFDPSKATGGFGSRIMTAGGVTMATGNPLLGIATYLAEKGIQSPEFRNAAFKAIEHPTSKTVGNALRLYATQKARD